MTYPLLCAAKEEAGDEGCEEAYADDYGCYDCYVACGDAYGVGID